MANPSQLMLVVLGDTKALSWKRIIIKNFGVLGRVKNKIYLKKKKKN
jgi:hypothetical protein